MIIAGWADGYRNNSFRLMERLRAQGVPHRLLAGPWAHAATDDSLPGPRIDSMPEMVAWWDRWLRGVDNGVDDGLADDRPSVTCFVRTSTRPSPVLDESAGFWVREEWPSPRVDRVDAHPRGATAVRGACRRRRRRVDRLRRAPSVGPERRPAVRRRRLGRVGVGRRAADA